jgi:hypothetical protein
MTKLLTAIAGTLLIGTAQSFAGVTFDGSPGSSAPPSTLGGYSMTAFGDDSRSQYSTVSDAPGPNGDVGFSSSMTLYTAGSGWNNWSHGYSGDVYHQTGTSVTMTLPENTVAFYFYSEVNLYTTATINATTDDGTSSGNISVTTPYGAKYFGFYGTGGSKISTITVTVPDGVYGFAVGEFGIFQCESPTISVSLSPNLLWPPNHTMQNIAASVTTTGTCTPLTVTLESLVSDEADNGEDDGNTVNDIDNYTLGTNDQAWRARAERSGVGDGRVYTATYKVTDALGNESSTTATVTVPLNQTAKPNLGLEEWDGVILTQNAPNPVVSGTSITFKIPTARTLSVVVYNVRGQEVRTLSSGDLSAGDHTVYWDGRDAAGQLVPAGEYIYRLVGADCGCAVGRTMSVVR